MTEGTIFLIVIGPIALMMWLGAIYVALNIAEEIYRAYQNWGL